jgi:glycosyltransferase involved in cell wall biosynthesis
MNLSQFDLSFDLSVIIATYNGEQRLPEVFDRLKDCCSTTEVQAPDLRWEIIVVDNNSTDGTSDLVACAQQQWSDRYPLRYHLETRQGAGYARRSGVEQAQADLIGFLDDDNLPDRHWVLAAYAFAQNYPLAGAFGSQIHGLFEVEPPEELQSLLPFLAIVERGDRPLLYKPQQKLLPPSAGLVVRKQAWQEALPKNSILTGRTATSMLTSEDLEVLAHIQGKGWQIWYNPAMQMHHKIPAWRLQRDYLIPFFRGIGLSRHVTRMLSVKPWQRPLWFFLYLANDLRKILRHQLRFFSGDATRSTFRNLATDCQGVLFWNSLISPVYIWRRQLCLKRHTKGGDEDP